MSDESAVIVPAAAGSEREFRNALGMFATGVAIVTAIDGGRPIGMTINSFVAISLHPPLIAWSLSLTSPSAPAFTVANYFAINVLAANQVELSRQFSRASDDKFAGVEMRNGVQGVPLLAGAAAHFECRREHLHAAGDHRIVIGTVESCVYRRCSTLLFAQGRYHRGFGLEVLTPRPPDGESEWEGIA